MSRMKVRDTFSVLRTNNLRVRDKGINTITPSGERNRGGGRTKSCLNLHVKQRRNNKYIGNIAKHITLIRTVVYSRVHITKQTLDFLGDKFEVEQGEGGGRDAYLADHKIETYLIVPPKVSVVF